MGPILKHDLRAATRSRRAASSPPTLEREVVCQGCGGRTAFTGTLTATRCPYCATPIQRGDLTDAEDRLPVDGVVPFRIDEKSARQNIEKWINSRWFTPKEFKTYRKSGSFESVFLAHFSFDARAVATYAGRRGEDHLEQAPHGYTQQRVTSTRWQHVSGRVYEDFRDVTAWANDGLSESHVCALGPWPLHEAVPYAPEHIAGHVSRPYDLDARETFTQRMCPALKDQVTSAIRRDIGGDHQQIQQHDIRFTTIAFAHLLLPVWLLTVPYAGRPYQVLLNGVTGEVQGVRPWSKAKLVLLLGALVLLASVIAVIALGVRG